MFGYDVFISFALGPPPRGTHSYASDLARRLRERDFTVFFSEDEASPGDQLDSALSAALRRSRILVVIANRGTLEDPRWVRKEVEQFRARHPTRSVIPISVGRALQDPKLAASAGSWLNFQDKIWLDESEESIEAGIASEALVDRLATAPTRFKSNSSWRWVVRAVVGTLAVLAIALAVAAKLANDSAERARAELRRAVSLRLAAQAQAMLSGARSDGDERALLQLVAAHRIASQSEVDTGLLNAAWQRRQLSRLIASDAPVTSVAFSPDSSRIVSGDRDFHFVGVFLGTGNKLRIWDGGTGQPIGAPLRGHASSVEIVVFHPDGSHVVSGSADGTIRIWNSASGEPVGPPIMADENSITSVALSPDGSRLASTNGSAIRQWDFETRREIAALTDGQSIPINTLVFGPGGKQVVSGSYDPSLRFWEVINGKSVATDSIDGGGAVRSIAFSPDGARLVTGGYDVLAATGQKDDVLRLWDVATGEPIGDRLEGHSRVVNSVAFSPDGSTFASGSGDHLIRLWDANTGRSIGEPFEGHTDAVNSVAFSPDGRYIVSGGEDQTIRVWHSRPVTSIGMPIQERGGMVTSVGFSPDGRRVVSGNSDGSLRVWDAQTGDLIVPLTGGHDNSVDSVAFSPDGTRIVSASNSTLLIWDASTGDPIGPLQGHLGQISSVAWSPDGNRIASGGFVWSNRKTTDHTVRLWDAQTRKPIGAPLAGHETPITTLAFSPDGRLLASGDRGGTLRRWDVASVRALGSPMKGYEYGYASIAFSADGRRIVALGNTVVQSWDAANGRELGSTPLKKQEDMAYHCVALSPDGSRLVTGSRNGGLLMWDAMTGQPLGPPLQGHTDALDAVAFSPDGSRIVSGSADGTLRIWPAAKTLVDVLCAKLNRNMSQKEWREWVSTEIEYIAQCRLPIPPDETAASDIP